MALSDKTLRYTPQRVLNLGLGDTAISGTHAGTLSVQATVKDTSNNVNYGVLGTGEFNTAFSHFDENSGVYAMSGTQAECNEALKNLEFRSTFAYGDFQIIFAVTDSGNATIESCTISIDFSPEQYQHIDTGTLTVGTIPSEISYAKGVATDTDWTTITHQKNGADIEDKIQVRFYYKYHTSDPNYSASTPYFKNEDEYGQLSTNLQVAGIQPVLRRVVANVQLLDPLDTTPDFANIEFFPHSPGLTNAGRRNEFDFPKYQSFDYGLELNYDCDSCGNITSASVVTEAYCGEVFATDFMNASNNPCTRKTPFVSHPINTQVLDGGGNVLSTKLGTFTDLFYRPAVDQVFLKVTGQFTYAWEFTGTASQIAKAFDHVKYLNNTGKTHEVELKVFNGKETVIR